MWLRLFNALIYHWRFREGHFYTRYRWHPKRGWLVRERLRVD